ncbi:hypothetical protein ANCDUO_18490 [Ancylostoma duodenale]|uniref:Glucuronosyltransferase n=1 Tax=Ancylostoma duodenale TaxID=51022 RepID=A0A0C2FS90_9BILA|nr:hypothetical protein ANCDUO_18490 [Ancylostoma duodenale]
MGCKQILNVMLLQYYVCASNILIWNPLIAHSHVKFLGNIADVLTTDGHSVVCCSASIIKGQSLWQSPSCTGVCFKWNDYDVMYEQTLKYCKVLLEDVEMLKMLNESKFELAYVESFDTCAPGIFQVRFSDFCIWKFATTIARIARLLSRNILQYL